MDACGVSRRPRLEVRVIALKDWYFIKMSLKTDSFSESMFANRCIITHLIKKTLKKTRKKKNSTQNFWKIFK